MRLFGMPLNYSKFDHLVDSDDEKPGPQAAAEARRKMLDEMRAKVEDSERSGSKASATDRFSYAEGDFNEVAQELLKLCVAKAPSVKVANGVLSVALVEKVEGEASMFQVRGQTRHTWDMNFKVRWTYQWMGSNFEEGPQRAEGQMAVCEFTDATTLHNEKNPPLLKKNWVDKGKLDLPRQKEVERALGGKPWPAVDGTLLASVVSCLEVFTDELPKRTQEAVQQKKEMREASAQAVEA